LALFWLPGSRELFSVSDFFSVLNLDFRIARLADSEQTEARECG
jgi:hypothetical protein